MSLLALEGVSYSYHGKRDALRDVSLSGETGELIAIVGENGSGKSTLLRVLARVLTPTSGAVMFEGRNAREWNPLEYARKVGYLPQELEPVFATRALEVVLSGRFPWLGRFEWESAEDLRVAREALAICDAAHLADRRLDEMSGGERRRILLARVLAGDPGLVLLDEPLTALDPGHVQALGAVLRGLVDREGRTVVVVSHDLNWAAAIADRMIVLADGRLVYEGPPSQVMTPEVLREHFRFDARTVSGSGSGDGPWLVPKVMRGGRGVVENT